MEFSKVKPAYLILVLVFGLALWKLPEALRHSEANEQSQNELNTYLEAKGGAMTAADSSATVAFLQTLEGIFTGMDSVTNADCQLNSNSRTPRILDWNLMWYLFQAEPEAKTKDLFFDRISILNSQNPFPQLNLTVGDGFTNDIGKESWNPGTLSYIRKLQAEKVLFIAKLEDVRAPRFYGEDSFQAGIATIGIWACDLATGKALCKHSLAVQSDDSFGLPLKTDPMNNKLRIELLEKAVKEVKTHCRNWLAPPA